MFFLLPQSTSALLLCFAHSRGKSEIGMLKDSKEYLDLEKTIFQQFFFNPLLITAYLPVACTAVNE